MKNVEIDSLKIFKNILAMLRESFSGHIVRSGI